MAPVDVAAAGTNVDTGRDRDCCRRGPGWDSDRRRPNRRPDDCCCEEERAPRRDNDCCCEQKEREHEHERCDVSGMVPPPWQEYPGLPRRDNMNGEDCDCES